MGKTHLEISVSEFHADDASQIAELYLASRADALPYLRRVHTDDEVREWIRTTILQRGVTLVAREGEGADVRVVGFLSLVGTDLDQLYVLPNEYHRGIGSRLLAHAKALCPGRLHLYTFQKNQRARAFYEKHGFKPVNFSDGGRNEEKEPDILYEWTENGEDAGHDSH